MQQCVPRRVGIVLAIVVIFVTLTMAETRGHRVHHACANPSANVSKYLQSRTLIVFEEIEH